MLSRGVFLLTFRKHLWFIFDRAHSFFYSTTMTGRGKPRKTKSLDESKISQDEMNPPTLSKRLEKGFSQDRVNGTAKEQKKKKNPSEEIPQEANNSHHRTPADRIKAPAKVTNPETCTKREKTTQQSLETMTKTKPVAQKDTAKASKEESTDKKGKILQQSSEDTTETKPEAPKTLKKASIKATKAKPCGGEAKLPHQPSEETTEMKPEVPKTLKKASIKATKAKPCGGEAKLPHQPSEETTETKPEVPKTPQKALIEGKTAKPCVPPEKCADEAAITSVLCKTLDKLKIKTSARSDASEVVNNLIKDVIKHMKENTTTFQEIEQPLRTGSYYEYLKISNPDEFDVMLPIPVDRVDVKPFGDDGAFYSVGLKRGKSPLKKFQKEDTLSASQMLDEFREEVKKCAKKYPEWKLTRKKAGCPAVTLTTTVQSIEISLDVVLSLVVKSHWPSFTDDGLKIERWLGSKVRQEYRWEPYYLVPKYEGRGNVENNGVLAKDVWRVSFSHIEKKIMKKHGSDKTCCEKAGERCCRKDCLKLLKHLLSQLKEEDSSLNKFCSYHVKTTLLHACCTRTKDTEWRVSDLSRCFLQLLDDFVGYLERGVLKNFFIPSQNLLSGPSKKKCTDLAARIKEERSNGFPIFKRKLKTM
ncbi:cyclic GMP-AMP synthase [Halichoeres trimaculatus]|uniref:cyclic GMP-AMP synthase n=1 Tax=Halichoeres trimaculatus TaxID=147232 RepID=UPI003D9E53FE